MVPLERFELLFLLGFMMNAGYLLMRRYLGSPVAAYIRLERDIRKRLKAVGEAENEEVNRDRKATATFTAKSEKRLRHLLTLSTASLYFAAGLSLVMMIWSAYGGGEKIEHWVSGLLIVLILYPAPLTVLTLSLIAKLYLGKLQKHITALATKLSVLEAVQEETAAGNRMQFMAVATDHIERALGGR